MEVNLNFTMCKRSASIILLSVSSILYESLFFIFDNNCGLKSNYLARYNVTFAQYIFMRAGVEGKWKVFECHLLGFLGFRKNSLRFSKTCSIQIISTSTCDLFLTNSYKHIMESICENNFFSECKIRRMSSWLIATDVDIQMR